MDNENKRETVSVRQGVTLGVVRYVLIGSLTLAVVAMVVVAFMS